MANNLSISTAKTNPSVEFVRAELVNRLTSYELIADCISGEKAVKSKKQKYLPQPNSSDASKENDERYNAYITRANFYNVTNRTLNGLCGQIFLRDPEVVVPKIMEPLITNADGSGLSLVQLAKETARAVLSYGRGGLFTDYPAVQEPVSIAQLQKGDVRPTIEFYKPEDITNWRTTTRGATVILSLVVLREKYVVSDDGFNQEYKKMYRVLRLDAAGEYTVQLYKEGAGKNIFDIGAEIKPRGADGRPLTNIPFTFVGSATNNSDVDEAPMYDIASLNIAHYRNSADYEDSCFFVGQPTPVFTGLTEDWVTNVLKGKVMLGSRGAICLPENSDAKLLQAEPNSMPKEAMVLKQEQMISLGAKLIEGKTVQVTATEAVIDKTSANSILADVADNVAQAIKFSLEQAALYYGAEGDITYTLNKDFTFATLNPEERRQLMAEWQGGAISFTELRANLRRAGVATEKDDEKARSTIQSELGDIPGLDVKVDNNIKSGANDAPAKK